MTYQRPEEVVVRGETMGLFTTPLDPLMEMPGRRVSFMTWRRTSLARGYIGRWEIDDDGRLFLVGFDPEYSSVRTLVPTDVKIEGWMAVTALPDGAPQDLSFGAASVVPDNVEVVDGTRTWFRHRDGKLVVALRTEDITRWRELRDVLALTTTTSSEGPTDDGTEPVRLHLQEFEPITAGDEVAIDRLRNFLVVAQPIDLAEPPWTRRALRWLNDPNDRAVVRWGSAYVRSDERPERVDFRRCQWFREVGSHVPTTADIQPGAWGPIPATWFNGELRLVPFGTKRTQQRERTDGRYTKYSWDGSTFDRETIVSVHHGVVVGERRADP